MDSDVEMVEPPALPPHSPVPSATSERSAHVSPPRSRSKSVLDDLDDDGSPVKGDPDDDEPDADDNDDEQPDADDGPPPATDENDPDQPMSPLDKDGLDADPEEVDVDSDSENSSDDASEDDVDKDLIPDADVIDTEAGAGKRLSAARWDEAAGGAQPTNGADGDVIVIGSADSGAIRIPVLVDPAPPRSPTAGPVSPTSPLSAPPTSAAKPAPAPAPAKKPKSHHAPAPPPPPPPPLPMQTIRLEIRLGGPDNYEIDVKGKARDEGFIWGELVSKKYSDDSSDEGSDGEDGEGDKDKDAKDKDKDATKDGKDADGDVDMDADGKPKPKKAKPKKSKKSKAAAEYYDVSDPFIDDSELAIDERTYFAQTKQKGFYVSSGEVALVRDKSPKKPKSRKKMGPTLSLNLPTASTSTLKPASGLKKAKSANAPASKAPVSKAKSKALGTKDSPIALEDDDEDSKADIFGGGAARKGSGSVKGKEKAEEEGDEAMAIAEGVNRMKGKWKERVAVNGNGAGPAANGAAGANGEYEEEDKFQSASAGGEEDGDDEVGKKRKRATNGAADGAKKRKTVDIASFHPELQASIEKMKQAIAAESWETKSKFPPNLKPLLAALSMQAITLDEYDDQFFNLMPMIFPYNKFTMQKLIKRTIFADHTALLNQRQEDLLEELKVLAAEGFPRAQEEWERNLQNYEEKRKEKAARVEGDPEHSVSGSAGPTRHPTEDPEARVGSAGLSSGDGEKDKDKDKGKGGEDKEGPGKGGAHHGPPLKKYRMTEAMKSAVWQLVLLSNEICRLENEKNALEGSVLQVSEQGLRKVLYQKILAVFPEGWMSSGQISRDVSAMKKKYEKEVQDE